jgi:small-conductance mechanosensitive channel
MESEHTDYLLLILITLLVAILLSIILRRILNAFIHKSVKTLKADPTNFYFLKNSITFIIFVSAFIFIFVKIPFLKELGTALFAGAGIIGIIVGFASQKAVSNIISGVFLLMFKPFRVGDIIQVSGQRKGVVEEITLWHTLIKDYENRRIIIPNNSMSESTLVNSSIVDDKVRRFIEMGISYDSDIDKAMKIMLEEASNHPSFLDIRNPEQIRAGEPAIPIQVIELGDYSVVIRAWVWAGDNDKAFRMNNDLFKSVKARFDAEGIEIPFPYRNLIIKGDEKNKVLQ